MTKIRTEIFLGAILFVPIDLMRRRLDVAREDSDMAYFFHLLYFGEMLVKTTASGLVAAIRDDRERHRYRQLYRLVRADGLGEWSAVIDDVLTGPAAQFLMPSAYIEQRELSQRYADGTWQYQASHLLQRCLDEIEPGREKMSAKVDGKKWFSLFAELRNKTRAHGAPPSGLCSRLSPALERSANLIADNLHLFRRPWVYLYRSLSKKYRVTRLSDNSIPFDYLRSDGTQALENGVYVDFDGHARVELISSDPEASDFFFPNGAFTEKKFEKISYVTDNRIKEDAGPYLTPASALPQSETHGLGALDIEGRCFTNLPAPGPNYVARHKLEDELFGRLVDDRHPVITVRGTGGIGKTSLGLAVLHRIAQTARFGAIIWFSARDIDLLESGPKDVRPQILSEEDIAREFVDLMQPEGHKDRGFRTSGYLSDSLTSSPLGEPILFVFDNFETVRSPGSLFSWIDSYIRNPNKVLITTRFSDFKGDYPVEVFGMSEQESDELIAETSHRLKIRKLLTDEYRRTIHRESDGHPYVIKILLGEVAKAGSLQKVERIISGRADILDALFERTYSGLSPAAKLVFMTLCNWRSVVPQLAVEAVMLRPQNEKFDTEAALEELRRSSFVETTTSADGNSFLSVPLVAAIFGKRKLLVSAEKTLIESNAEILRFLGATQKTDIKQGVGPRFKTMFSQIAERVNKNTGKLSEYLPVMEFIATRYPPAWLLLARLFEEGPAEHSLERAKYSIRRYLELTPSSEDQVPAWRKLSELCRWTNDWNGEIHALVALVEVETATLEEISAAANRINQLFATQQFLASEERNLLVARLVTAFEAHTNFLNATDCSRLAWLYLHLHREDKARQFVDVGLDMDPLNEYCLKLKERLQRMAH